MLPDTDGAIRTVGPTKVTMDPPLMAISDDVEPKVAVIGTPRAAKLRVWARLEDVQVAAGHVIESAPGVADAKIYQVEGVPMYAEKPLNVCTEVLVVRVPVSADPRSTDTWPTLEDWVRSIVLTTLEVAVSESEESAFEKK